MSDLLRRSVSRRLNRALGGELAQSLTERQAILGIFDEGCMGMYNAIIDDELLNPTGIYKERLSQSALYAGMRRSPMTRRMPPRLAAGARHDSSLAGSDPPPN